LSETKRSVAVVVERGVVQAGLGKNMRRDPPPWMMTFWPGDMLLMEAPEARRLERLGLVRRVK
jgi:hypothetical protein